MIEQDPRITEGATFFQSLYAWMKRVATNVNVNEANIALKANIDSPTFTGDPKAPTPANSDNDTSVATTGWVNSAMATIATAAGFVFSNGTNGYFKFPSWLGSFIIQWGSGATTAGGVSMSFPIAFPTNVRSLVVTPLAAGAVMTTFQSLSNSGVFVQAWRDDGVQIASVFYWIAVGY